MLFSSIPFLYRFLPVVLVLYFCVPAKWKNVILLVSSLFFYAWGEPKNVVIMMISIFSGYVFGILIEKNREKKAGRYLCGLSVMISLGFLIYFKYVDFFIENVNRMTGLNLKLLKIALPIGISFFTFQIISYTVDVARGEKAQRSFLNLAAYISMFPQLIAGPIVRYADIREQLEKRTLHLEDAALGIRRFVIGLAKKVLLANQLGELTAILASHPEKSVLLYWISALAFTMQIYFDFSGYSDMAIGLGKILGFHFLENFQYPFIARSITEFWRRWHISLGSWFRDYVYIPMGGNRVSKLKHFRNILVVWMLTGFWHGAEWNFIFWGLFFAVILIIEKSGLLAFLKKHYVLSHIYVIFLLLISFVLFDAKSMPDAMMTLKSMFGLSGLAFVDAGILYYLRSYGVLLGISMIASLPVGSMLIKKANENKKAADVIAVAEPVILVSLMLVITAFLVDGSFNPFLYFRF